MAKPSSPTAIDARVLARARETFNTSEQADRWLNKTHKLLGMSPAEYLKDGGSITNILKILNAISYGGSV